MLWDSKQVSCLASTTLLVVFFVALAGCGLGSNKVKDSIELSGTIEFEDQAKGLRLTVYNPSNRLACIPMPSLSASSGALKMKKNGFEAKMNGESEYGPNISGYGPFYIVSPGQRTNLPLDTDGLILDDGIYDVTLSFGWIDCDKVLSSGFIEHTELERGHASGLIEFIPFE